MYTKNEPEIMLHAATRADVFSVLVTFKLPQKASVIRKTPCMSDKHLFVLKNINTGEHCTLNCTLHISFKSSLEYSVHLDTVLG